MDRNLAEKAGIPFHAIYTGKLRRYFSLRNFIDPFLVLIGFFQSLYHLLRFRPNLVFSKGGFVSLPVTLAAFVLRIPVVLHECDSVMGLANRISSRFARKIATAFPILSKNPKVVFVGNPLRPEIFEGSREEGFKLTGFTEGKPVLLVWGGSQGAKQINQFVERGLPQLSTVFQVILIAGTSKTLTLEDAPLKQFEFVGEELKHLYAITDLAVGRAGANSLFELAALRIPNIAIPLPNADQLSNAAFFENAGASLMVRDTNTLENTLISLWNDAEKRHLMQSAQKKLVSRDASEKLINLFQDILS